MDKKGDVMKATPFSSEHYYPLVLASGKDAVLINYDGSNFVSRNGHTHAESHQGAPLGWYKMSNAASASYLQPIAAAGIQVICYGAPMEPRMYEQDFDPRTATVTTALTFINDLRLTIESFMTTDSIWCEKVTVVKLPSNMEVDIAFELCAPSTGLRCMEFKNDYSFIANATTDFIECSYTNGIFKGKGLLTPSAPFDTCFTNSNNPKDAFANGKYVKIKPGFSVSRTMILCGAEENVDFATLAKKASLGFEALHTEHKKEWKQYFDCSDIEIPDSKLKGVYDFSRYVNKSHQHPLGQVSLGMLPNLWYGGVACAYDQSFTHAAFLTSGNFKESQKYTDSYLNFADDCREILKEHGIKGTTFYGWISCDGQYVTNWVDKFKWITSFKPMYSAFSVIAIYNEWIYNPEIVTKEHIKVIEDQLLFYTDYMLLEEDEVAYIRAVNSGTECGFAVEVDTMTQSFFAAAFQFAGEMLKSSKYIEIAKKMYRALRRNCDKDGMLLFHKDAPYIGGLLREVYFYLPNEYKDIKHIVRQSEASITPWGTDNDVPTEEYRHWPWNDPKEARMYIRKECPEKAMPYIQHIAYGCSSLGALPEKIRLDGYPINYYYTSTTGLAVTALNEAFACNTDSGAVILAGGISKPWMDFSCRDIRVNGNIAISFTVADGQFVSLSLKNDSKIEKEVILHFNEQYVYPTRISRVLLKSGQIFTWNVNEG